MSGTEEKSTDIRRICTNISIYIHIHIYTERERGAYAQHTSVLDPSGKPDDIRRWNVLSASWMAR